MSNSIPFPLFNYQGKRQFKHKQHQEKKNISSNHKHHIKSKLFKEKRIQKLKDNNTPPFIEEILAAVEN